MKKTFMLAFCLISSHVAFADEELFMQLDTNKDGLISIEEAASDSTVTAKFTELDSDKDGFLSAEEFDSL
jgi:Ca2+-binding EF-hand superfamily protein